MSQIFIFDFDDSFTFNIANRLLQMNLNVKVISPTEHENCLKKILKNRQEKVCLILGPGPGHPNDYQLIQKNLKKLLNQKNLFLMGICLGHQILMKELGFKVMKKRPAHGIPMTIKFEKKSVLVQQYNSLFVKTDKKIKLKGKILHVGQEVLGYISDNLVTWQFHPESVGTSCPFMFFSSLPKFLYNFRDGHKKKNQD